MHNLFYSHIGYELMNHLINTCIPTINRKIIRMVLSPSWESTDCTFTNSWFPSIPIFWVTECNNFKASQLAMSTTTIKLTNSLYLASERWQLVVPRSGMESWKMFLEMDWRILYLLDSERHNCRLSTIRVPDERSAPSKDLVRRKTPWKSRPRRVRQKARVSSRPGNRLRSFLERLGWALSENRRHLQPLSPVSERCLPEYHSNNLIISTK